MSALRTRRHRLALQKQTVNPHDTIDALGVNGRRTCALPFAAKQAPYTPVTVAWKVGDGVPNFIDQTRIIGVARRASILPISRARKLCRHVRARYTEDFTNLLHWSSPGND
jgi:hypothetical protein